jgi:hypothetical protein
MKEGGARVFWLVSSGFLMLAVLVMKVDSVGAQDGYVKDSPLFIGVKDPKTVARQIHAAMPAYERGLDLLSASNEPESTALGVRYLIDAYHYLRGAYEGNQLILVSAKFPDPLLEFQNRQIMDVRNRIVGGCTSQRTNLVADTQLRGSCIDGLRVGLRTLRMISATLTQ